jgi:hypothetical protein
MPKMISYFRINHKIVKIASQKFELNVPEEPINLPPQDLATNAVPTGNLTNSYRPTGVMKPYISGSSK